MEDQDKRTLSDLLTQQRVATLAVLVDGAPFASLVPFAALPDLSAALIHVSGLARHSEGLGEGAEGSLLIHQQDSDSGINPAQLARVSIQARSRPIARDTEAHAAAREIYLARFPKSEITFQLGDFQLVELGFESLRFVAGFGKTFDIEPAGLGELL